MDCPDDNALISYVERTLPPAEHDAILAHLDRCEACLTVTCAVASAGRDEDAASTAAAPTASTVIANRYTLVAMIGRGGMGSVFTARDRQLDRLVALKLVRADRLATHDARARLSREARAMAKVKDPNVVTVYDAGELEDGGVFIAMELVEGETLAAWLRAEPRTWRASLRLYLAAGRGLAAAHAAGIVHRDFKPENVLVERTGRVAVADFGLAFSSAVSTAITVDLANTPVADALTLTQTGALMGTPIYMSPEQFRGDKVDARTDQFSFAVALYEAVHGVRPFTGTTIGELCTSVLSGELAAPPAKSDVPPRLHQALVRALSTTPDARFPSMDALLAELEAIAAPARAGRLGWILGGAAVLVAGAAAVTIAVATRAPDPSPPVVAPIVAGPPVKPPRTAVLIEPLHNSTRDPRLDDSLDIAISASLARSTKIDAYAGLDLLELASALEVNGATTDDVAKALAARDGIPVIVVTGAVAAHGAGFTISLASHRAGDATAPQPAQAEAASLAELLPVAVRLGGELRARAGDPSPNPDAARPASASVEAVHEWAVGQLASATGDFPGGLVHLRRAVAADPAFAQAHAALGLTLYNLTQMTEAAAELELALRDPTQLPERMRLMLLGDFYAASGRYNDSIAAYQQLLTVWPGDARAETAVVATAIDGSTWPLALELARRAATDHPNIVVARANLVLAELANGKLADAVKDGRDMLARFPHPSRFGFAFVAMAQTMSGAPADARSTFDRLAALDPEYADEGRADQAQYEGRLADAEALLQGQIRPAVERGKPDDARTEYIALARLQLRRGDLAAAAAAARAAVGDVAPRVRFVVASILIAASHGKLVPDEIKQWADNPSAETRMYGKLLEGDVLRARGQAAGAVAAYKEALRQQETWIGHERLGRAYLAAGAFSDADRELASCLARRGEAAVFMTPGLSYLPEVYLLDARALDAAHRSEAIAAYRAVVALAPAAQSDPWTAEARKRLVELDRHGP